MRATFCALVRHSMSDIVILTERIHRSMSDVQSIVIVIVIVPNDIVVDSLTMT